MIDYQDILEGKKKLTKKNAKRILNQLEDEALNRLADDNDMFAYLDTDEMELHQKADKLLNE